MLESEVDRYKVIDTDTHVIEPYDLWTSRLDVKKWGDKVPHVKFDERFQEDAWYFGDKRVGAAAAAAQAGWGQYPPQHPPRLSEVDPATWEATARLNVMDKYGIWAAVLYPNVAGFGAGKMLTIGDGELMLACVKAYNDFLAEYSSIATDRFIPIMALPFWDLELTEKEIDRAIALGHKGVIMTGEPFFWGMPKLGDPHWDRLWAKCQDTGMSVNFHIGSGDMSIFDRAYEGAGDHANYAGFGVQFGVANVSVIANLITGGVCHRFPDQKFVSVESGVGWIPFLLDALDYQCGETAPEHLAHLSMKPSEYFRRQFYGCFWFESRTLGPAIDHLGAGRIMFETDIPHPTCLYPHSVERVRAAIAELEPTVQRRILQDNAAELYKIDVSE